MPRRKRSTLPEITDHHLKTYPDRIRPTPNGGYAWTCHYCNHYASSETLKGRYVCRRHGGYPPRLRDPLIAGEWLCSAGKLPKPPGRPPTNGKRVKRKHIYLRDMARALEEAAQAKQLHYERMLGRELARAHKLHIKLKNPI